MRTLESRLNEIERALSDESGNDLPPYMYMTSQGDDEQTVRQKQLEAYENYKALNLEKHPQLASMSLDDLLDTLKDKQSYIVHIQFVDYAKKEGAKC